MARSTILARTRLAGPPRPADPAAAFGVGGGPWLVVAPHDDDAVLGAGLAMLAAREVGIAVHVAVVTDGRMGWSDPAERDGLVARRAAEMVASSALLGVDAVRIHRLGFPDGAAARWSGIHDVPGGEPRGLTRALCAVLRRVAPTLVLAPTPADLHGDHRAATADTEIACFMASGGIWRELGAPVALPTLAHYAVYCPFDREPTVELRADADAFERKLAAIAAFASQPDIIAALVDRLRGAGPVEYFAHRPWPAYDPRAYAPLFAERSP